MKVAELKDFNKNIITPGSRVPIDSNHQLVYCPSGAITTSTKISIGNNVTSNQPFRGSIAKARFSDIARSQSYLLDASMAARAL